MSNNQEYKPPDGPPPGVTSPPPVHHDAGPYNERGMMPYQNQNYQNYQNNYPPPQQESNGWME
ncbi:hypothetical protein LTR47_007213 [Exophiala xenobiotica]|nr:hypothetical protein LTR47_007213 [Exophiala xenobiotica]